MHETEGILLVGQKTLHETEEILLVGQKTLHETEAILLVGQGFYRCFLHAQPCINCCEVQKKI